MDNDSIYEDLFDRIQAKFAKLRPLNLHLRIFALFTLIAGVLTLLSPAAQANGNTVYFVVVFAWSIIAALHAVYTLLRSGAWVVNRERVIQAEVQQADKTLDLPQAELIELHRALSNDISHDAASIRLATAIGVGYALIWGGCLAMINFALSTYARLQAMPNAVETSFFIGDVRFQATDIFVWQIMAMLLTLLVSVRLVRWRTLVPRTRSEDELRHVYIKQGEKSKRISYALEDLSNNEFEDDEDIQKVKRVGDLIVENSKMKRS